MKDLEHIIAEQLGNTTPEHYKDPLSRERIIEALSLVIMEWLEYRTEELFSKLYRLDIPEKDIKAALKKEDFAKEIAALIYERQIQKFLSRKNNPSSTPEEGLEW